MEEIAGYEPIFKLDNKDNLIDIIENIILSKGPCHVRISSFSINEETSIKLFFMHEKQQFKSLQLLFDNSVHKHKSEILFFLSKFASSIFINHIHSKFVLIHNNDFQLCILTSSNLNSSDRIESYIFFPDDKEKQNKCFNFYRHAYYALTSDSINIMKEYDIYK